MASLSGKVVIITGASSGIGAQVALDFARAGASVSLVARRLQNLEDIATKCREAGSAPDKVIPVVADVTDEEQVKRAIKETVDKFGRIDVLVNNAGASQKGGIDTGADVLDHMYSVNVKSVYMMSQHCLPHLATTKGSIVNLSSISGTRPIPGCLPYAMSKAAVEQFTKIAALEVAKMGVRVNAVCPGLVEGTEIFTKGSNYVEDPKDLKAFYDSLVSIHPLGRCGRPADIAAAILFLASDAASFITGCSLPVDGGLHVTTIMGQGGS